MYETQEIIDNLGYVVGVCGPIGSGKSTSTAAITTMLEETIIYKATEKNMYIQVIMCELDFNIVNQKIENILETGIRKTPEIVFEHLYEDLKEYLNVGITETDGSLTVVDRTYHDGFKNVYYSDLMKEYIENYLALREDNFVYCNIKFTSQITGKKSFDLKGSDFSIKERYWDKDYSLRRYSVFFYDESTLDPNKLNLNWQHKSKTDDGTLEHLRLFRHYYKGTSYYLTTLQNIGRLNKSERELFNSIIQIEKMKEYSFLKFKNYIVDKKIKWNDRFYNWKLFFIKKRKRAIHEQKRTKYKKRAKKLMIKKDSLIAKEYIVYTVRLYTNSHNAENLTKNYQRVKLSFPKTYCFGPIDTYEFSYNYDASIEQSEVLPEAKLEDNNLENKIKLADENLQIYKK